jgi:hypothetical protein
MEPIGQPLSRLGRRVLTTIAATILLALVPTDTVAQAPRAHRTALWATAAFGPTLPYDWALVGSAGLRYSRVLVRARYAITFENPGARVDDVGVLVGVVVTGPTQRGQLSVGAGAGRVRQVYNCVLCSGPTFPATSGFLLDAQWRLALGSGFGATGYAFGNINSRMSFGGVAFGLFLGGL